MMSNINEIKYTAADESRDTVLRRMAAACPVFLRPPRAPADPERGARAVAGTMSRAALDPARASCGDGTRRADARVRCLERDGPRRSPRVARSGAPAALRRRSPRQGTGSHSGGVSAPFDAARAD